LPNGLGLVNIIDHFGQRNVARIAQAAGPGTGGGDLRTSAASKALPQQAAPGRAQAGGHEQDRAGRAGPPAGGGAPARPCLAMASQPLHRNSGDDKSLQKRAHPRYSLFASDHMPSPIALVAEPPPQALVPMRHLLRDIRAGNAARKRARQRANFAVMDLVMPQDVQ